MSEATRLFIQYQPGSHDQQEEITRSLAGADALVIDPDGCTPEHALGLPVENIFLLNGDPQPDSGWIGSDHFQWVCTGGLDETLRLRDLWPELNWVPRLTVYKPAVSYRFSGPAIGEGFAFYIPDTAAIKGWRVTDGDVSLAEAVTLATELGFNTLWLHSQEAEFRGSGLELEMLERASSGPLAIWISGGVTKLQHLRNLVQVGAADAVIVDAEFAQEVGVQAMRQALTAEIPQQEVPLHVVTKETQTGEV